MASSPITLVDDNSEETLVFQLDDGVASGSGSGSSAGGGGPGPMQAASGGSPRFAASFRADRRSRSASHCSADSLSSGGGPAS